MKKVDLKKELKYLYGITGRDIVFVDVPTMNFLMIDGQGNPNSAQAYQDAVEALYALSYAIKFMVKKGETSVDYGVMPLEGLWWTDDMADFSMDNKDIWKWTAMIMQPEWVSREMFEETVRQVIKSKDPLALPKLRLETYHEGLSVQILHIGSYDDEGPALHKMHHEFIPQNGHEVRGRHHEIYLSDPRRVAPEKLRTVLRQPVSQVN